MPGTRDWEWAQAPAAELAEHGEQADAERQPGGENLGTVLVQG